MMNGFLGRGLRLIAIFMLLTYARAWAQQSLGTLQKLETKLEAFEKRTGTVILKGFGEIGTISGDGTVCVHCLDLSDQATGARQMGIMIEVANDGISNRSFIDYDEIEPFLRGIENVSKVPSTWTKPMNIEAIYSTKDSFTIRKVSIAGTTRSFAESGPASAILSLEELNALWNLISKAKQTLDSIK